MTCQYQSRSRDRGPFTCALGRYAGRPYLGQCKACIAAGENHRGLGDIVETLAKPIAKALRMKCLDENGNLKPNSRCGKRKQFLNRITR